MKKHAIIVAGGEGTRMGGALPKQFQDLAGRPVLWWALHAFKSADPETQLIVSLNPKCFDLWEELQAEMGPDLHIDHIVVEGGASRTESVKNGLGAIDATDGLVAVHDAARPLVSERLINDGWECARRHGGAVPAVPVTDSLRQLGPGGESRAVDRSQFVAVQTPQVFDLESLRRAYAMHPDRVYSDDASAFEDAGMRVALFDGDPSNIKVTNPGDMETAAALMKNGR